jgi:hypothetical protein
MQLLRRRDDLIPKTQALVTKLVRLIVETGMLTAMTATIDLILFMVFPHTAYHAAVALTLAKLYSNSMLVILNSRLTIPGGRNGGTDAITIDVSSHGRPKFATRRTETTLTSVPGVHIQEQTWVSSDAIPLEPRMVRFFSTFMRSVSIDKSLQNSYGARKPHDLAEDV